MDKKDNKTDNKKENKKSYIVIILPAITTIIGIIVLIFFLRYNGITISDAIRYLLYCIVVGLLYFIIIYIPFYYIAGKVAEERRKLVDSIFLLDIYKSEESFEHIRITEKNILFKYILKIKFNEIFPKFFSLFTLRPHTYLGPAFVVKKKYQLSKSETESIIKKILDLDEDLTDKKVIINHKGIKKYVSSDEVNKILSEYSIRI